MICVALTETVGGAC